MINTVGQKLATSGQAIFCCALKINFSYFMQGHESGRCIHTSYFSSPSLCWCSASPTGADTPWPTATTPPDQPTTPTPASLVLVLGLVGETSVSRVLETSAEGLVIVMASALRDSYAPIATGLTKTDLHKKLIDNVCLILRCQGCSLTSFTCWYDDHCRW